MVFHKPILVDEIDGSLVMANFVKNFEAPLVYCIRILDYNLELAFKIRNYKLLLKYKFKKINKLLKIKI